MIRYMPAGSGQKITFLHTKPICIVDSLDDLQSDIKGEVVLPNHLDWTPCNRYDLSKPEDVKRLYATVLNESTNEIELIKYINYNILIKYWQDIPMSKRIRTAWEKEYPLMKGNSDAQ